MLTFQSDCIFQKTGNQEKIWTIPQLLESPNPLDGEPLAERNAAMKQVVDMAMEQYSELSEAALLRYDFWKQLIPGRVAEQHFEYETKNGKTHRFELTINHLGLFYKNISEQHSSGAGTVTEQLFSDFWFYGPLFPVPDLHIKKMLIATIRNAFIQGGSPASYHHFKLSDTASLPENRWEKSPIDLAESKRLFMDSGGQTHYIYLDGDGDRYFGTPSHEAKWRKELLENYEKRLGEEDNVAVLDFIARNMSLNGVDNIAELLEKIAKTAPPNVQKSLEVVIAGIKSKE